MIVLGFVVADFIGDAIMRTQASTQTAYTSWFIAGSWIFIYFTVIVIGPDTMGVDVGILFVFFEVVAWGLAAAVAIGVGIAVSWDGHTSVQENIDRWMGRASAGTPSPACLPTLTLTSMDSNRRYHEFGTFSQNRLRISSADYHGLRPPWRSRSRRRNRRATQRSALEILQARGHSN